MSRLTDELKEHRLLAIVRLRGAYELAPVLEALERAGVKLAEITLDTPGALAAINALSPSSALTIGVGTVTEPGSLEAIQEAGARFIVTPGLVPEVVEEAKARGLGVVCGAMTPGEMLSARRLGADVIKLFPAAPLGPGYLKQVLAPLAGTPILAVGGIDADNARDYLAAGAIGVAVGSALVAEESVRAQDWPEIERRAGALVAGLAKS